MRFGHLAAALLAFATAGAAAADPPGGVPPIAEAPVQVLRYTATRAAGRSDDRPVDVMTGRLMHTRVRVRASDMALGPLLDAFSSAVGVGILPLGATTGGRPGLDLTERVTLEVDDAPAHEALEHVLESAMPGGATWQVGAGAVEVGPRSVLARSSARRTEAIPIRDLLLEPPTTENFGGGIRAALQETFPDAVVIAGSGDRSTPTAVAAELVLVIERDVEPEAWAIDDELHSSLLRSGEIANPLARLGQWASMTARDGVLLVTAPDFVLRGIRGYPGALPPAIEVDAALQVDPRLSGLVAPETPQIAVGHGGTVQLLGFVRSGPKRAGAIDSRDIDPVAIEALGRLAHARVRVILHETPCREALALLSNATGAAIDGIWTGDGRNGLDPEAPLTIELDVATGIEALEMLLDLAATTSPATWQLSGQGILVGPKLELARGTMRRSVRIDVRDLLIEPPYFISRSRAILRDGLRDVRTPLERQFGRELGMERDMRPGGVVRKSPQFIAAELLLLLEKHVEPRGWIMSDETAERRRARGDRTFEPLQRHGEWITATYLDGTLVLSAPDFVLREIVGYPHLPSPAGR